MVLTASVLWALGYFTRKLVLSDVTPVSLTFFTFVIVVLFLAAAFRPHPRAIIKALRAHFLKFAALGFIGSTMGTVLMFTALDHLDLGVTTLLEKLQPLFIVALAGIFLKERLPSTMLPFCVAALISSYFIAAPDPVRLDLIQSQLIGIACVIGAALCWAVASIIGRSLMITDLKSIEVTFLRFTLGAVFLSPFFLLENAGHMDFTYSPMIWAGIVFAAVVSTGTGYALYYGGLKHIPVSTAGFLEMLTPLVSVFLGIGFLGESLSLTQILFMPVLIYSIYKIGTYRY